MADGLFAQNPCRGIQEKYQDTNFGINDIFVSLNQSSTEKGRKYSRN
jgi:hypothetical protein